MILGLNYSFDPSLVDSLDVSVDHRSSHLTGVRRPDVPDTSPGVRVLLPEEGSSLEVTLCVVHNVGLVPLSTR